LPHKSGNRRAGQKAGRWPSPILCKNRRPVVKSETVCNTHEEGRKTMPVTNKPEHLADQPLIEHLRELRSCLAVSFVAVGLAAAVSYYFIEEIGHWLFRPLVDVLPAGGSLIFTSYQEGFFFILSLPSSAA
jgi:sec-independent protein translocase protein TatC